MPTPIGGVNGATAAGHASQPSKQFTVELPNAKPSRKEVAEATFRHFGFTKNDTAYLKRKFNGTDPTNYFANTLKYNPRSISTANGKSTMRLELNATDYDVMRKLAAEHHPQSAPAAAQSSGTCAEAAASKRVFRFLLEGLKL